MKGRFRGMPKAKQIHKAIFSPVDLITLKLSIEEHVCISYIPALKRCVAAGLVVFCDNGKGKPFLTEAGRTALKEIES